MAITILRRYIPADRPAGIAVDIVGSGTSWSGSTTFTLSGVSPPPAVLAKIVHSATSARLVLSVGHVTTNQQLTISDGPNSGTAYVQPIGPAQGKWFPGLAR